MDFRNTTPLDDRRLLAMYLRHTEPYDHSKLTVRVRPSRGAAFSGSCYYRTSTLYVNLGVNRYPYALGTHIARSESNATHWWREVFRITIADAYQLAVFVYLHELYHYLVRAAGRNIRRKEGMCDRFAARVLADSYGCAVRGADGRLVPRSAWDFQDLDAFVSAAPRRVPLSQVPVRIVG